MKKILLKFRINPRKAGKLIEAGCPVISRTAEREKSLIGKHADEAKKIGQNPNVYGRIDAAGNKQADSGNQFVIGGVDKKAFKNICTGLLWNDIPQNLKMHLTHINLFKKEGDEMYFMTLAFEKGEKIHLSKKLNDEVMAIRNTAYKCVYVWNNPNGVVTINCLHVADKAVHNIRIKDGSVKCELI